MAMVQFIPRPAPERASSLDFGHLDRLRAESRAPNRATEETDRQVARQFEALLVQQMLKQARQTDISGGLFDSQALRMTRAMHDEQLALDLADPGFGLAEALLEQIRQGQAGVASAGPASTPFMALLQARQDAPAHVRDFVQRMGPAAEQAAGASGLPASLILSQAALETGWGKREILHEDGCTSHNLFGIKAGSSWNGKVVNVMTTEVINGQRLKMAQPFRAYDSYAESFTDYARLITRNQRYSEVLHADTAQEAARRIQAAGYATDPGYADKLIGIMAYFSG